MNRDDYVAGEHHYWPYFWCGLIAGGGFGAWFGWRLFDSSIGYIGFTAMCGVVFAFCSGRWGDSAWRALGELFYWFRW